MQKTIDSGPCPSGIFNCNAVKSKSFGKFNVYFEEMLYTRMEEVPDYEVSRNQFLKIISYLIKHFKSNFFFINWFTDKSIFEMEFWAFILFQVHTFFSDIGGVLGFYVGFSVLTCVEFLELGLDVLRILYNKSKPKKRNVRSVLRERFEVMCNEMFSQPLPGSVLEKDNLSMTFKSCKNESRKMPQVD